MAEKEDMRPVGKLTFEARFSPESTEPSHSLGQAKRLLSFAEREAELIRKSARGGAKALLKRAEAQATQNAERKQAKKLLGIAEERASVLRAAEKEIVELAFDIAERVVGSELQQRPESIVERVQAATQQLIGRTKLTIELHPADKPTIETTLPSLKEEFRQLQLRGAAVLSSGQVRLELSPSKHLQTLRRLLQTKVAP